MISFAASGGTRSFGAAAAISDRIHEVAGAHGFPDAANGARKAEFDTRLGVELASTPALRSGEALRDDVWSFIAAVLAPDVAAWRYPDVSEARLRGGVRNVFQRCWIRAVSLDRGEGHPQRWELLEALSEDAMVQIFERASLAGNHRLARFLAEEWVAQAEALGSGRMEKVMRRTVKTIRLRNEVVDLASHDDERLASVIRSTFLGSRDDEDQSH
jgi:hypothetical protein